MNNLKTCAVVGLLLFLFVPCQLRAGGPWAAGKKSGYSEIGYSFNLGGWTTENTLQIYSEIGVTKNLSLKGIFPLKFVGTQKDETNEFTPLMTGQLAGVGNQTLGKTG